MYLCLSEDVSTQLMPFLQYVLGLFGRDVYPQGGACGEVDEAVNDDGNLLLDASLVCVVMTEVLHVADGKLIGLFLFHK